MRMRKTAYRRRPGIRRLKERISWKKETADLRAQFEARDRILPRNPAVRTVRGVPVSRRLPTSLQDTGKPAIQAERQDRPGNEKPQPPLRKEEHRQSLTATPLARPL